MFSTMDLPTPSIEVPEEYIYISSDGTKKDVRYLHTEYLVNSLAKAHKEIYNSVNNEVFEKYFKNIDVLTNELSKRIGKFKDEKFGGNK